MTTTRHHPACKPSGVQWLGDVPAHWEVRRLKGYTENVVGLTREFGWDDGRGNPPNPNGLKTDYPWKEALTRDGLTNIIENYFSTTGV